MKEPLRRTLARLVRWGIVHVPPRRKGLRLSDWMQNTVGFPKDPLVARHVSGYRITCHLEDGVQRALFFRGTFEPEESRLLADALHENGRFLDLGANAGHFTFLAAKKVGPRGVVHAVEASPAMARQLQLDVDANGLGAFVHVHAVAAADEPGVLNLVTPGSEASAAMRYLDPTGQRAGEAVRLVRVDDLLPDFEPDVIKVDVEGADLRALKGMTRILSRHPRLVVVEAMDEQLARFGDSTTDIVEFMNSMGYSGDEISEPWHAKSFVFRPHGVTPNPGSS